MRIDHSVAWFEVTRILQCSMYEEFRLVYSELDYREV